jgi:hypothetical protein
VKEAVQKARLEGYERAFYLVGGIDEALEEAERLKGEGTA